MPAFANGHRRVAPLPRSGLGGLARELDELRLAVSALQRQRTTWLSGDIDLGAATFTIRDDAGVARVILGAQSDGSFGLRTFDSGGLLADDFTTT